MQEDRISQLPKEILHHILFYLKTKEVVRTCLLSQRWRHVWADVPYLNFDYDEISSSGSNAAGHSMIFLTNFIQHFLLRRHDSSPIISFILQSRSTALPPSLIESFISYAVEHHVQKLSICAWIPGEEIRLPQCLFYCKSLKVLQLCSYSYRPLGPKKLTQCLGLSSLKTLAIHGCRVSDGMVISSSSCPNLENLIVQLQLDGVHRFYVDCPTLKVLKVGKFGLRGNPERLDECEVRIFAPQLADFLFQGRTPVLLQADDLASLENATVEIRHISEKHEDEFNKTQEFKSHLCLQTIMMLHALQAAKSITLSWAAVEVLSRFPALLAEQPFPFANLKYLKLEIDKSRENLAVPICVLAYFLRRSVLLKFV